MSKTKKWRTTSGILFFILVCTISLSASRLGEEGGDGAVRVDASLYIPEGGGVTVQSDLLVIMEGRLTNDGHIYFKNRFVSEVTFPGGSLGAGSFFFQGDKDYYVDIPEGEAEIGTLNIDYQGFGLSFRGVICFQVFRA